MVFVDQAQAAASHRKREDYIISGLNYALLYPPGGYTGYVRSTRDGYRSGTLKNLTSSNIWWWKVDCGRKRYRDSLSLTNLDSVDWKDGLPGTNGATLLMNICLLPSYPGYY
jgi:hypothetical protein